MVQGRQKCFIIFLLLLHFFIPLSSLQFTPRYDYFFTLECTFPVVYIIPIFVVLILITLLECTIFFSEQLLQY